MRKIFEIVDVVGSTSTSSVLRASYAAAAAMFAATVATMPASSPATVTIGTLDGANIEILEQVGDENFFVFGLDAQQVATLRGDYDPRAFVDADERLAQVMALLNSGHFNQFEPGIFDPLIDGVYSAEDPWMTAADFSSFVDAQALASAAFRDRSRWLRMSILNTANSGLFSSDRTIAQYNAEIWKLPSIAVNGA